VLVRQALYHLNHADSTVFVFLIFWIGSHSYVWASMDCDPIYTSCTVGMAVCTTMLCFLSIEMECLRVFAQNCVPPDLCLLSS
jgi:hypothetical protein